MVRLGFEHDNRSHTSHESNSETITANNPSGNGQRANEVCGEIRSLQTTGLASCDIEGGLEVGVQSVEQAIAKAPEEEEDGD
jgi:hypothetical protein